jgi:hypothetical protein
MKKLKRYEIKNKLQIISNKININKKNINYIRRKN